MNGGFHPSVGDVLETAVGTGLSLSFYNPGSLRSFTGLDISMGMISKARGKAQRLGGQFSNANFITGDVAAMPFGKQHYVVIIHIFLLCNSLHDHIMHTAFVCALASCVFLGLSSSDRSLNLRRDRLIRHSRRHL